MLKKVAFTMYPVEDMERAAHFYKTHLGLTPSEPTCDDEEWLEFDLPQGGCFAITTLAEGLKPGATSGGRIAFEVENLDELTARLKANNVHFELDTVSFPVCRMAIILDSEGNAIILHELKNR